MLKAKEEQAETLLRIEHLQSLIKEAQKKINGYEAELATKKLTRREKKTLLNSIYGEQEVIDNHRKEIEPLSTKTPPRPQWIMQKLLFESRRNTILLRIVTHPALKAIRDEMIALDIDLRMILKRRMSFKKYVEKFSLSQKQIDLLEQNQMFEEFILKNMSESFRNFEKEQFIDDYCWAMSEDEDWEDAERDVHYDPALESITFNNCCHGLDLNPIAVRDQFKKTMSMGLEELVNFYNSYVKPEPAVRKKRES